MSHDLPAYWIAVLILLAACWITVFVIFWRWGQVLRGPRFGLVCAECGRRDCTHGAVSLQESQEDR